MNTYYLAVDIGASSGRHILGYVEDGRIKTEEIYRFSNGLNKRNGHLCWDYNYLFQEIKNGLKKCKELGKIPVSMGIDTWAVDFVLLDGDNNIIGDTVGYRDSRTLGIDKKLYQLIPESELYLRTGIQRQSFNTIYQLYAIKEQKPEDLSEARAFLMVPDYFNFLLTGEMVNEYTNATTTQLVAAGSRTWDYELISALGYPKDIFNDIKSPGTLIGGLSSQVVDEIGFDLDIVLPATHDTGSAVMAVPSDKENPLYISSGTWSLMGTELDKALCNEESRRLNFTNEGGYGYRYRFLKNIMGLWMIQGVKSELNDKYSFEQLCSMADDNSGFKSRVDVNHGDFLAPDSMIDAIVSYCKNTGQEEPSTPGEISACIYLSLAECYGQTVREIETLTGKTFETLHIIGGGSNADYLNKLTAKTTKKTVCAGPSEATALGNLAAQMLSAKEFTSLKEVRRCIYESFQVKVFKP